MQLGLLRLRSCAIRGRPESTDHNHRTAEALMSVQNLKAFHTCEAVRPRASDRNPALRKLRSRALLAVDLRTHALVLGR